MCTLEQLWLVGQLIKSAATNKMIGGGMFDSGLFRGGMGADVVRKGMQDRQKLNLPMQRLALVGKMGKLFKPRPPYNAIPAGEFNAMTRAKYMYPVMGTHEEAVRPLRARYNPAFQNGGNPKPQ